MNKVSVIIPNYNGMKFLPDCMAALAKQTFSDFEIIVIDNASADGSAEWLREHYPQVRLVANDKNEGFSGAVNQGIRLSECPYVLLLNNDTEAAPEFVENLVRAVERSERIFSVSSRMMQFHDREKLDDAGDLYCLLGWAFQRGVGRPARDFARSGRVFSACAGAAIYRRAVFEEIGCFDRLHFAYLEDIDVGYRARIAGYENHYEPSAVVYHVGSGTSGSRYNGFKVKLAARNGIYLNYKNMPALQLILNALPLALGIFLKLLFFQKMGFGKDYRDGLREGIRTRKQCRKVPFCRKNFGNYVRIELELIGNTFLYAGEFLQRRLHR